MASSPATRRYNRRVIILSVIYALALFSAVYAFNHQMIGGPGAGLETWIVAALPALPIIGIFIAIGRLLVEETDEYLRMLLVRQTLWASSFSLSLATLWGFLESFELVRHVDSYYVAVLWFGGLGLGSCMNRLTMRDPA
jgi:hypothetical protein